MRTLVVLTGLLAGTAMAQVPAIPVPAAITADGLPALPDSLRAATQPYLEVRPALVQGWNPKTRGPADHDAVRQRVSAARGCPARRGRGTQLSFESEPIGFGAWSPGGADALLVGKDVGGGEFFQLYALAQGRLTLLTDGKSRNEGGVWSRDGALVGYTSTRRDGTRQRPVRARPAQAGVGPHGRAGQGKWLVVRCVRARQRACVGLAVDLGRGERDLRARPRDRTQ